MTNEKGSATNKYPMMGVEATPPMVAPLNTQRQEHWKHFDDSVNAVSFGIVATAILISMFLLLAIFERFLRQRSTESRAQTPMDLEDQMDFGGKFENPSPKMTIYGSGVLVLMPGEQVPTFIALPAPAPCSIAPLASMSAYNLTTRNMIVHPFDLWHQQSSSYHLAVCTLKQNGTFFPHN